MRVHTANVFLGAGIVIWLLAMWFLLMRETVTEYSGTSIVYETADRIDTFTGYGLFVLSMACIYIGWTLIKKKKDEEPWSFN